jgi:hypothetical protein
VLTVGPTAATTEVEDVDGGPPEGCWRQVRQQSPPKLKMSMAGSLGVLAARPAAATTEVGDIDGGHPRGCWRQVRQRPPSKWETSMAGPLGGAGGRSGSGHHQS